ncbi:predicted protein [Lichtheimia corymbifera JMRC:FSU:9682]|uniref:Uncharacterized protein n=1 Tax=Lichtheimia corymbifera JMRC:FSU:9682 TaxID=1263082 RepID=A0A068S2T1_9FUNG|nr:predicted protein [Lichtheimia corymbifera JMRC:FSU:9682]
MVSTSTTTCQIKLKWHSFFMWIKSSSPSSSAQRKRSTRSNTQCCGFCGHHSNNQQPPVIDDEAWKPTPRRGSKSSNTSDASAGTASTSWSTSSKPIMSLLFRRRASASVPEMEEIDRERERIEEMYAFAMDELNFAEDSQGSPYYEGDRITAHEAIDNCTATFMQLLKHISDHQQRNQLQQDITPRLIHLQERYNALPPTTASTTTF